MHARRSWWDISPNKPTEVVIYIMCMTPQEISCVTVGKDASSWAKHIGSKQTLLSSPAARHYELCVILDLYLVKFVCYKLQDLYTFLNKSKNYPISCYLANSSSVKEKTDLIKIIVDSLEQM